MWVFDPLKALTTLLISVLLVKFQVAPSIIITSARSDDEFLDIVSAVGMGIAGHCFYSCRFLKVYSALAFFTDESLPCCELEVRPSTDFIYQTAKNRLLSLRIAGHSGAQVGQEQHPMEDQEVHARSKTDMFLYLESVVSLDCREMVSSLVKITA